MKVLLSAYACEPGRGSEPEVGLNAMFAAASAHDVWVLTRHNNVAKLEELLAGHPDGPRIEVVGCDLGPGARRLKKRAGRAGLHAYYHRWQARATGMARDLHRQIGFDVVHHATFATYWQPSGMADVGLPFVWGPVGGAVSVPDSLLSELGRAGRTEERVRKRLIPALATLPGVKATQRAATIALAQEAVTAAELRHARDVRVVSNATATSVEPFEGGGGRDGNIVFVGRLIPWKGVQLALRTMRHVTHPGAMLRIFGRGPERERLEALAREWGIADRVRFEGSVPRAELHQQIAGSGVVLHTSLRGSGLGVAESLALGSPVVCLDQGEVGAILDRWPATPTATVPPTDPDRTAGALAAAVDRFLTAPPPVADRPMPPSPTFREALLAVYDDAAAAG